MVCEEAADGDAVDDEVEDVDLEESSDITHWLVFFVANSDQERGYPHQDEEKEED